MPRDADKAGKGVAPGLSEPCAWVDKTGEREDSQVIYNVAMNANHPASLPVPDAAALARSTSLRARIAAEVSAHGGWLPFSRYMELALYTPGLGYYSGNNVKFGRGPADGSDFITAPELTSLFGQALARPVAQALRMADADAVLEFGAGSGKLAADLLLALHGMSNDDNAGTPICSRYTIVELSGELRARQHDTLVTLIARAGAGGPAASAETDAVCRWVDAHVTWIDRLPETFSGVVIGNEVLDAMPITLHPLTKGRWHERGVGLDGAHLVHRDRPCAAPDTLAPALRALFEHVGRMGQDYLVETHGAASAFVATVCTMLTKGAAIFIDYGFPAHEYYHPQRTAGTVMCHYRHQTHGDALLYPGLQDITAHVDFSAMAQAGIDAGADILGYMSQGRFLINCGIADILARQVSPEHPAAYLPKASAMQKLLSEAEMGELFKVIGFSRALDDIPDAFLTGDRSWTLLPDGDGDDYGYGYARNDAS